MAKEIKKVVLAYSGGLDTSIIIPWLKENYNNCEVIAVSGNVGQGTELDGLEEKAIKTGASKLYIEDLTEEFIEDYVYPTVQAGAVYENQYLLGTSFARPIIAKRIAEIAIKEGADAICHGCTGIATFHVYDPIWRAALDFTKGFKKYELITAMKFKSVYAMRFYELMSGQTQPLFVSLEGSDGLRERFCLQGKYERVNDFKRYVIDAAKKELDESSPYSFVAKEEKEGKKVIGWTLFPVFFEDREDPALQEQARMAKVTARLQLENNVYDYLKFSFDFKSDEVNKNKKTLIEGQNRIPNFMGFLGELKKGARLAENPKGYVIGAIKRKLKEI